MQENLTGKFDRVAKKVNELSKFRAVAVVQRKSLQISKKCKRMYSSVLLNGDFCCLLATYHFSYSYELCMAHTLFYFIRPRLFE